MASKLLGNTGPTGSRPYIMWILVLLLAVPLAVNADDTEKVCLVYNMKKKTTKCPSAWTNVWATDGLNGFTRWFNPRQLKTKVRNIKITSMDLGESKPRLRLKLLGSTNLNREPEIQVRLAKEEGDAQEDWLVKQSNYLSKTQNNEAKYQRLDHLDTGLDDEGGFVTGGDESELRSKGEGGQQNLRPMVIVIVNEKATPNSDDTADRKWSCVYLKIPPKVMNKIAQTDGFNQKIALGWNLKVVTRRRQIAGTEEEELFFEVRLDGEGEEDANVHVQTSTTPFEDDEADPEEAEQTAAEQAAAEPEEVESDALPITAGALLASQVLFV